MSGKLSPGEVLQAEKGSSLLGFAIGLSQRKGKEKHMYTFFNTGICPFFAGREGNVSGRSIRLLSPPLLAGCEQTIRVSRSSTGIFL